MEEQNEYTQIPGEWGLKIFRKIRNQMLSETDYLMVEDAPLTQEEKEIAKIRRQKLRDLTTDAKEWFISLGLEMEINQSEGSVKFWIEEQLGA